MPNKVVKDRESFVRDYWLGHAETELALLNPFPVQTIDDIENPHIYMLRFLRQPDNFFFTCKHILNIELLPFQLAILKELWFRKYPMLIATRGGSKSFMLGLYAVLRALLCQGKKVVIVGAAFRQAKIVFEYAENIWYNAPILRDIVGGGKEQGPKHDVDRHQMRIGDSVIIALPLGTGEKIAGQRANVIIADEFASIPELIYENRISGFAAVSFSPVEAVKQRARMEALKELGEWNPIIEEVGAAGLIGNQAIISGTAYYAFNHYAKYWKRYKAIIESKGDRFKLMEIFGGDIPANINHKDYSIIRIPVELLPDGFMDEQHVARSKATQDTATYQTEFAAIFPEDSTGFFKRSLIETCVCKDINPVMTLSGPVCFQALLRGSMSRKYVIGVDPASERDKFSIVVLEIWPDHKRIVYVWTTSRAAHQRSVKKGLTKETDFYGYCARKIRDLKKVFPTERIAIDSQGGGVAVEEALHDKDKLLLGEIPIWPVVIPDDQKETDAYVGEHILELVNFADSTYTVNANHGLRKDFEDKATLFPFFDTVEMATEEIRRTGNLNVETTEDDKLYDTLENCYLEIEALKDELTTIVHTQTANGRDRWDTPEIKLPNSKKGRLRKDRYSALVMANMTARTLQRTIASPDMPTIGGFAHMLTDITQSAGKAKPMYVGGAEWFTNHPSVKNASFGQAVSFKTRQDQL